MLISKLNGGGGGVGSVYTSDFVKCGEGAISVTSDFVWQRVWSLI